jgi:hypothetical protein
MAQLVRLGLQAQPDHKDHKVQLAQQVQVAFKARLVPQVQVVFKEQ